MNALTGIAPTDLRGSSPTQAGGGRLHDPDPVAVQHMRQILAAKEAKQQQRAANGTTAVAAPASAATEGRRSATPAPRVPEAATATQPIDPRVYPAAVREAAARELAKPAAKRRYAKVFTREVVAIWQQCIADGTATEWSLTDGNGLVPVTYETIHSYLVRHKGTIKKATAVPAANKPATPPRPAVKATSVPVVRQPEVVAEAKPVAELAEAKPVAEPVEAQTASDTAVIARSPIPDPRSPVPDLIALLNAFAREHAAQLRGSISINLEIKFGGDA